MDSWVFDHSPVPAQWTGRFGASVPVSVARETIAVLPVQGASIIEVGPVKIADVEGVRRATARRRCRVMLSSRDTELRQRLRHTSTASSSVRFRTRSASPTPTSITR
jgi:hypothetical protein